MRLKTKSAASPRQVSSRLCAFLPLLLGLTLSMPALAQEADVPDDSGPAPDDQEALDGEAPSDAAPEETDLDGEEATADAEPTGEASSGGLFEASLDGGSSSDTSSEGGGDLSLDIGGYVRGDAYIGVIPRPPGFVGPLEPAARAAYGELALQMTARKGSWGDAFAEARFRYGQQLEQHQLFVDLREAYVNGYFGPVDIRFGKQIVAWGRADAFNPTNNVTPTDFRIRSPREDDKRVGNVGARAFVNFQPFRLEGVWMPLYEPTMLPDLLLEDGDVVYFLDPNFPSLSVRNGLYAARLHLILSAFEASVSYLYGDAPLPGYNLVNLVGGNGNRATTRVEVARTSYNHHVIGADFATTVGTLFGLRGELAYREPIDYANRMWAPNPDLQYVVGLDREFGPLSLLAQYMGRYTFNWFPRPAPDGSVDDLVNQGNPVAGVAYQLMTQLVRNKNQILFSQLAEVQHLATARAELKLLHETLSVSAVGMMNFTTSEWLLSPQVAYQITGGLSTTLGAEIYAGPDDTLFGMIDESLSSGFVELRLDF